MPKYKIDNKTVDIPDSHLKDYLYIGICYFESGIEYVRELYVTHDGRIIDPKDTTIVFPEYMYDEEGKRIEKSLDDLSLDSAVGFEYQEKLYLENFLEKL